MTTFDNGQKSMQRTLVKMTVTTVQLTLDTIQMATMQLTLGGTPDQTTLGTTCRTTRDKPRLDNGKQKTNLSKLDAVNGHSVETLREQGDTKRNQGATAWNVVRTGRRRRATTGAVWL
jgi:hypothetical protein